MESDDEDEWVSGPGDDDDDKDDDKDDGSGDDKREMQQGEAPNVDTSLRQRPPPLCAGVCIHRGTQHTMERGSVEVNPALCLLCACHQSGSLRCLKTC